MLDAVHLQNFHERFFGRHLHGCALPSRRLQNSCLAILATRRRPYQQKSHFLYFNVPFSGIYAKKTA
jgi:hypothetical protein